MAEDVAAVGDMVITPIDVASKQQDIASKQQDIASAIIAPVDAISVKKRNNASWAAFRGAHKISRKTNQSTKGNTSGLIHRRSYADVAATPA